MTLFPFSGNRTRAAALSLLQSTAITSQIHGTISSSLEYLGAYILI